MSKLFALIFVPMFSFASTNGGGVLSVSPEKMFNKDYAYFIKSDGTWDTVALGSYVNGKWTQKVYQFSVANKIQGVDALTRALEESAITNEWSEVR